MGGGSEDGESCTAADGEARPCPASTARHTSGPARSAEFAVRELNGARALFDADLSFVMFERVHWSILFGANASAEGSSRNDGVTLLLGIRVATSPTALRPGVPCSQHVAFASSIALCADITDPTELPAQELLDSQVLKGLRADYIRAKQQKEALVGAGKGENHPSVRAAASVVEISRTALLAEVKNIREALRRDVDAKRREEGGLAGLFSRAKTQALELNRLGLEYRRLERSKNNTEKVYSLVLERSKESDLTRYMRFNNIRVIDDALAARSPIKPRTPLNLALGGALGLFFGFFAAFGRNALDRTFKSGEDVESHLGLTMLGVLPLTSNPGRRARRGKRAILGDELVIHRKPNSSAAEAARALRTNLMFTSPDNPQQLLMVTSGGPLEGKTTVACWIATAMAQAGKKVLLIDSDLRRPRLHRIFGRTNDRGVSTYLLEESALEQDNLASEVPNLDVITAGPGVPNPAELLQSERFGSLLAKLRQRYDRIILDTPPVNAVTDAAILSTKVDGVLLIVRAHTTTRDSARHSVRALVDVSDKLLGVVLNAFDQRRAGYGYGYGAYRYQYYYGSRSEHEGHSKGSED